MIHTLKLKKIDILGESKKVYKKVTTALILDIWLGFDRTTFKLDYDMANNQFGSLSIRLTMLKQPPFENWQN